MFDNSRLDEVAGIEQHWRQDNGRRLMAKTRRRKRRKDVMEGQLLPLLQTERNDMTAGY